MHNDGYEKHVCILGGCQVLYLDQNKIDKYTYNGSQLNRDMIISLANNNPNYKFYVVTTCMAARTSNEAIELTNSFGNKYVKLTKQQILDNNRQKLKNIFVHDNVEFVTENKFRFHGNDAIIEEQISAKLNGLVEYLRNEKIDFGVIKGGLLNGHVPFLTPKISNPIDENGNINKAGRSAVVEYNSIYSVYVVNNLKFPYITINDDDNFCGLRNGKRYNKNIIHPEVLNINMYNGVNKYELYKSMDANDIKEANEDSSKLIKYEVPVIFKEGMDAILLKSKTLRDIDRDKIKLDNKSGMFIYVNFREKNSIRYDRFNNFILNNDLNTEKIIWSNLKEFKQNEWENGYYSQYGDIFSDNKGHKETMEKLCNSKYTFCMSVFKKQFCIGRFWEAIYCKCIPFIQRESDDNNELIDGIGSKEWVEMYNVPEFLFVKTPEELKEKIELLENSNDKYLELIEQLDKMLKPEYSDPKMINNIIIEEVKKLNL